VVSADSYQLIVTLVIGECHGEQASAVRGRVARVSDPGQMPGPCAGTGCPDPWRWSRDERLAEQSSMRHTS